MFKHSFLAMHAPLCVIFALNSGDTPFLWHKSLTNCDIHLPENNFQTRSRVKFLIHICFPKHKSIFPKAQKKPGKSTLNKKSDCLNMRRSYYVNTIFQPRHSYRNTILCYYFFAFFFAVLCMFLILSKYSSSTGDKF